MFRPAARTVLRAASQPAAFRAPARTTLGKRFASTSPASSRRSWKSSLLRWGIAIGGVYYYNTSPIFAEQPQHNLLNPNLDALEDPHDTSSLETLTSRRSRQAENNAAALHSAADAMSSENASTTVVGVEDEPLDTGSAAGLEEEAASEGAFNPETGEINWDCPCLGGMAHGPCGPEFREAFSCFVFSTEEPKGMDCIDKFQNMQQCFQKYPEIYKGELEDDEELNAGLEAERQELVNEIAERRAQESGRQRRLLEEPEPTPKPSAKSAPKAESQPAAPRDGPKTSDDSAKNESKVTVSGDATMSPERANITEGQTSQQGKQPKPSSADDQTFNPEAAIVPKAAHDATSSS